MMTKLKALPMPPAILTIGGAAQEAETVAPESAADGTAAGSVPEGNAVVDIKPVDPACHVPGRFAGKTAIVTGLAHGRAAAAALRLAREDANVVGIDWIEDLGRATHETIPTAGGKSVFVQGDIADPAVPQAAVGQAAAAFGGLDLALNNAGAMDGVLSGDEIDYAPYGIRVNPVTMPATDTPMVSRAGQLVAASGAGTEGLKMGRLKTDSILSCVDRNHRPATVDEQVAMMPFLLSDEAV